MKKPILSKHFQDRSPSAIRSAQILFSERKDKDNIRVINLSIGNISLPMYPAMKNRLKQLGKEIFSDGVIKYTPTVGSDIARKSFINILQASEIDTSNLFVNITDGGSSSMELMMLGTSGPSSTRPIMLLDPAYTNYIEFAKRLNISIITCNREIKNDGSFKNIDLKNIKNSIYKYNPSALVVIPYDNPSGQFISQKILEEIAKICVENNIWMVSDEAYRPLYYLKEYDESSIWKITDDVVPGILGRRISIESASKVWNACGLRIGGIITDNENFHKKAVSEYTANLCANTIGQEIFGVLAHESHENIRKWYNEQIIYYQSIFKHLKENLLKQIPGLIVTDPESAIYCIIDFKNICNKNFDAENFVKYCARQGKVKFGNLFYTILLAPMSGFYTKKNNGKTQLRLSIVESEDLMKKTPAILAKLYQDYTNTTE
tara:strand:+ start:106 stop:1404 length:1299 start_codon:yes stop_codon:yes gene_type:complete